MLLLPTFNATLTPCPVEPAAFGAHEKGHFCGSCQRVVQDFSQSTNPVADLAAAHAAAPDGRVCGMFRRAQTTALPPLTRRLRWFLVALVLVLGQGLTAREALAQVRQPRPQKNTLTQHKKRPPMAKKQSVETPKAEEDYHTSGIVTEEIQLSSSDTLAIRTYAEVMPTLRGRDYKEVMAYIQQQVRWPAAAGTTDAEGRVFVRFTVGKDGLVRGAKVLKGIHPLFDGEALRIIQSLPAFTPGRQDGKLVAVSMVVPITFKLE